MGVDIPRLLGKITESGFSQERFAEAVGIGRTTWFSRMRSKGADFTVEEIDRIVEKLGLSEEEAHSIFKVRKEVAPR